MSRSFCLNFKRGCKEASAPVRDSGIPEILACGIRNPGLWYLEYSSKNPEYREQLESKFQRQTEFWNCRRVYIFQLQDAPLTNKCGSNISKFSSDVLASY